MELTLEVTPEIEARLRSAAEKQGVDPAECVQRLLSAYLPAAINPGDAGAEDATIALLNQWTREDATDDPEEIARRDQEWEELKAQMNETRAAAGARLLFP